MTREEFLLAEIAHLQARQQELFDAIAHGDDEHRAWLKAAIDAHFADQPIPPATGAGTKEARIAHLQARVGESETVIEAARAFIEACPTDSHDRPHLADISYIEFYGLLDALVEFDRALALATQSAGDPK